MCGYKFFLLFDNKSIMLYICKFILLGHDKGIVSDS